MHTGRLCATGVVELFQPIQPSATGAANQGDSFVKHRSSALALALTGLVGASMAQTSSSSVQLYGTVGAAVTHKTKLTGGDSATEVSNSLLSNSLFGLRGTEDLGGGNSAQFGLESRIGVNNGTAGSPNLPKFWDRQAWVGVNYSPALSLRLGRQFHVSTERAIQSFDVYNLGNSSLHVAPFGFFGVNRFVGFDGRPDSSIKLRARSASGLTGAVSVGLNDGGVGRSASFDVGQVGSTYSYGIAGVRFESPTSFAPGTDDPLQHTVLAIGGNVELWSVRWYLVALASSVENNTVPGRVTEQKNQLVHLGANWRATPNTVLKAGYYFDRGTDINGVPGRDGDKTTLVVSGEYFLSKRTSLNLVGFVNRFTDGYKLDPLNIQLLGRDPASSSTQGVSFGVRHDF
jgi:predicted porin